MAEQLSGVPAESLHLDCYCASGGGYLGGHGPLHPAVSFSKLCCLCVGSLVRVLDTCLGNLKWSVAFKLGLLFSCGCPLSFGPVRFSAFSVLGSRGGGASSQRLFF